jgi:hypothetical protein
MDADVARCAFQYVSDLHLELLAPSQADAIIASIERRAPNLILAGDIGRPGSDAYLALISAVSGLFERVFVVAGNHEFYGSSLREMKGEIEACCAAFPNVHFLNDSMHTDDRLPVHVFGGTMWSLIRPEERAHVERILSDMSRIRGFGTAEYILAYYRFIDLLQAALDEHRDKPFVVISHHLPMMSLIHPDYKDSCINSAFASDTPMALDRRIAAWVHGHTHKARPGPRFFCNPIGYAGENRDSDCNRAFVVSVGSGSVAAHPFS